jgi:hypothetical protein
MRARFVPFLLVVLAISGALALLRGARNSMPSTIDVVLDAPTLPSSVMRVMSLGFQSIASDAEYLQAIQVFGDRTYSRGTDEQRIRRAQAIYRLLDYATDFDGHFSYAYVFGANAIPTTLADESPVGVLEAIQLLKKGSERTKEDCRKYPDEQSVQTCDWRVPFYLAYLLTTYTGDYSAAAEAMAEAARRPKHPEYTEFLATRLAAVGGAIETGLAMCQVMEAEADSDEKKELVHERCLLLEMERDLRVIENAVTTYLEKEGRFPASLQDVQAAGLLGEIPPEPHGGAYEYDRVTGAVRSTAAERLKLPDRTQREVEEHQRRLKAQSKEVLRP